METGDVVLETRDLHKSFGGVLALAGVDFRLMGSEIRGLIGPNGAGKTTLINVLTGLFPPTGGQVWLGGREITHWSAERIARSGLGRTFQLTAVFPGCSVMDNVLVAVAAAQRGGRIAGHRPPRHAALEVLARVGLQELASQVAANLSHGDQKLLELAVALAMNPSVLLLDEPTAGMSPAETRRTMDVIRRLREFAALVIVEHDMNVVMDLSDSITVLSNGRIIAEGPPELIRSHPQVREVYLGR